LDVFSGKTGNDASGSFFVGGYTSDGSPHEESEAVGKRHYTYHKREYVMPHDVTDKYRFPLLEPLKLATPSYASLVTGL
jgi:hypothetical protein